MLPEYFIYLAVAVSLIGQIGYLNSIVHGTTKPNLVSQFMWMLSPFVGVFFQLKGGAGISTLALFMSGFASLMFIVVSVVNKKAYFRLETFDFICGLFSVLALVCYVLTHSLSISILFAIAGDTLAYFPTIKKSWYLPESENYSIYLVGIISHSISLLVLDNRIFSNYAFAVSIIFWNSVLLVTMFRKDIFRIKTRV